MYSRAEWILLCAKVNREFCEGERKNRREAKGKNCYSEKLHLSYYILVVPYLDYSIGSRRRLTFIMIVGNSTNFSHI